PVDHCLLCHVVHSTLRAPATCGTGIVSRAGPPRSTPRRAPPKTDPMAPTPSSRFPRLTVGHPLRQRPPCAPRSGERAVTGVPRPLHLPQQARGLLLLGRVGPPLPVLAPGTDLLLAIAGITSPRRSSSARPTGRPSPCRRGRPLSRARPRPCTP